MLRLTYAGLTILCLSLWAGSLAAQTPAQKQQVEQLYAENADAWSRHDIAKIVSFFDPACVFLGPGGLRISSYAEWRKNLPAALAQERHNQVKITLKAVNDVENGFVASIERQDSYDIYDTKRSAWIPMLLSSPQENTWRSDGRGNFKVVLTKFLSLETPSPVVVQSGGYQLTEEMIQRALQLAQIDAGADFSESDAAALRADFIALFQKEPAKQTAAYENVAQWLQQAPPSADGKRNWMSMASLRDNYWQALAKNQQFLEWQSYPFGKMVLKYNPVVVNSAGMIITKAHVDSLFFSNALVAQIAGVPPPTQTEEDQYIPTLPAQFGSLTKEQQEAFRRADARMSMFATIYSQTRSTRAVMTAAIRRNVHSPQDVPNEARRVENSSVNGDYFNASLIEGALNVSTISMGLDAMRRQFLHP
jgi:ketosteroid isomerase-like protein